jgi:hypothetical protein
MIKKLRLFWLKINGAILNDKKIRVVLGKYKWGYFELM